MIEAAGRVRLTAERPATLRVVPLPLAAGAVAGFVLVAGLALWPRGGEEPVATAGVATQSEAGSELTAASTQPAASGSDGVIFPVDEASAAQIRPLALSRGEPQDVAPAAATLPPRTVETAAAPPAAPVTVATRSGPAKPRPAVASEAAAPDVAAEQAPEASPADPRVTVLSSRPMRRALAAPVVAPQEAPTAEPASAPEPQAEAAEPLAQPQPEAAAETPAAPASPRPQPRAAVTAVAEPAATTPSPSASVAESVALAARVAPPEPRRIAAKPAPTATRTAAAQPSTQAAVALAVATAAAAAPKPAVAARPVAAVPAPTPAAKAAPAPTPVRAVATREKVGLSRNDISLIGVFGSSNSRHALVRLPNGKVTKVERGDTIQGVQVAAIERSSVLLQGNQRSTVLKLPD